MLVRLFRSLDALVGGSREDAVVWMNSENNGFAGQKPVDLVVTIEGIVSIVHYLEHILEQRKPFPSFLNGISS